MAYVLKKWLSVNMFTCNMPYKFEQNGHLHNLIRQMRGLFMLCGWNLAQKALIFINK